MGCLLMTVTDARMLRRLSRVNREDVGVVRGPIDRWEASCIIYGVKRIYTRALGRNPGGLGVDRDRD